MTLTACWDSLFSEDQESGPLARRGASLEQGRTDGPVNRAANSSPPRAALCRTVRRAWQRIWNERGDSPTTVSGHSRRHRSNHLCRWDRPGRCRKGRLLRQDLDLQPRCAARLRSALWLPGRGSRREFGRAPTVERGTSRLRRKVEATALPGAFGARRPMPLQPFLRSTLARKRAAGLPCRDANAMGHRGLVRQTIWRGPQSSDRSPAVPRAANEIDVLLVPWLLDVAAQPEQHPSASGGVAATIAAS